jgi:hypothetical protein
MLNRSEARELEKSRNKRAPNGEHKTVKVQESHSTSQRLLNQEV